MGEDFGVGLLYFRLVYQVLFDFDHYIGLSAEITLCEVRAQATFSSISSVW